MAKLYFYYSAMNAGKSTNLLQANHNYGECDMRTVLITPEIDNRFERGKIHSRIGLEHDAIIFTHHCNLLNIIKENITPDLPDIQCVLVDEAQFLKKQQVEQLTDIADTLGIPVLAYGLRSDFLGEPFEGSQYLLAWADKVVEIKTVCHCGRKATMNMRVDETGQKVIEGAQIQIGGHESYVSTCRKHFKLGQSRKL